MKFPSPSLEVDGRADATAVHTGAGNLEAMKHTSSSHCAKERLAVLRVSPVLILSS